MTISKAMIEVEVNSFTVPVYARIENADHTDAYSVPLSSLDSDTLSRLCDEFRGEVFRKAGKSEPPTCAPLCARCRNSLRTGV